VTRFRVQCFTLVCASVCLCAIGWGWPLTKGQPKLWTLNLTCMFPRTVQTWSIKIFENGRSRAHVTPQIFWALNANCFNTVKDTDFKFDEPLPIIQHSEWTLRFRQSILSRDKNKKQFIPLSTHRQTHKQTNTQSQRLTTTDFWLEINIWHRIRIKG